MCFGLNKERKPENLIAAWISTFEVELQPNIFVLVVEQNRMQPWSDLQEKKTCTLCCRWLTSGTFSGTNLRTMREVRHVAIVKFVCLALLIKTRSGQSETGYNENLSSEKSRGLPLLTSEQCRCLAGILFFLRRGPNTGNQ